MVIIDAAKQKSVLMLKLEPYSKILKYHWLIDFEPYIAFCPKKAFPLVS